MFKKVGLTDDESPGIVMEAVGATIIKNFRLQKIVLIPVFFVVVLHINPINWGENLYLIKCHFDLIRHSAGIYDFFLKHFFRDIFSKLKTEKVVNPDNPFPPLQMVAYAAPYAQMVGIKPIN